MCCCCLSVELLLPVCLASSSTLIIVFVVRLLCTERDTAVNVGVVGLHAVSYEHQHVADNNQNTTQTSVSETIRKPPLAKAQSASRKQKKYSTAKTIFNMADEILSPCNVTRGSGMTCHWIRQTAAETIALNCLVFEKIAFLHFGDRQTD